MVLPSGGISQPVFDYTNQPVSDRMIPMLTPGGVGTQSFCFSTNGERGQFILRYKPFNDPERT